MTAVIQIEGLSKMYRLGTIGTGTVSHDLNRWWHRVRGKGDPYAKVDQGIVGRGAQSGVSPSVSSSRDRVPSPDYMWALRDVTLEVPQGEILGIIGRNGAGKSTLLKLLSRITAPTAGEIRSRGRIASLLEVGTGFHPELTGRENIYLNGVILGMKRREISRHLDDIVEFSGCAKHLDTPVKRYSSGMMVRLGFAVAAHLQCEILIVDEVLAVGDAEFQKRCIGKMQDMASNSGRTVLFVSHNMAAVQKLCTKGIYLVQGKLEHCGDIRSTVECYRDSTHAVHRVRMSKSSIIATSRDGSIELRRLVIEDIQGRPVENIASGEACRITLTFDCTADYEDVQICLFVNDLYGVRVARIDSKAFDAKISLTEGRNLVECHLPFVNIVPRNYGLDVVVYRDSSLLLQAEHAFRLEVDTSDLCGTGSSVESQYRGFVQLQSVWRCDGHEGT